MGIATFPLLIVYLSFRYLKLRNMGTDVEKKGEA